MAAAGKIFNIGVNVFVKGAKKGEKELSGLGKAAHRAGVAFAAMAATGLAVATREVIRAGTAYEDLKARLQGVEGSQAAANRQFAVLKKFAAETPFKLDSVTSAYIRMKAVGIDPTSERMKAFGNIAATFGRDMTDFATAVSSAITGEMEALKSFGIVAKQQGEQVTFTFKVMKTTVGKNADEIVGYLEKIGKVDFASGMELRAQTLTGKLSTLSDAWDSLMATFYGSGDTLKKVVDWLTDVIEAIEDWVELAGGLDGIASSVVAAFANAAAGVVEFFSKFQKGLAQFIDDATSGILALMEALSFLPGMDKHIEATRGAIELLKKTLGADAGTVSVLDEMAQGLRDVADAAIENAAAAMERSAAVAEGAEADEDAAGAIENHAAALEELWKAQKKAREEMAARIGTVGPTDAPEGFTHRNAGDDILMDEALDQLDKWAEGWREANKEILNAGDGVDQVDIRSRRMVGTFERVMNATVSWGDAFANVLSGIDGDLAQVARGIANIADGLGRSIEWAKSAKGGKDGGAFSWGSGATTSDKLGGSAMGMDYGKMIYGIGNSLGIWKGSERIGQYGEELSGDYADKGAEIGGAIGGYFGPVWGIIGAAAGGIIGGFIKKGADEGLASIRQSGEDVYLKITKSEHGLGKVVTQLGEGIMQSVASAVHALGGNIEGFADMDLKIRDGVFSIFSDAGTQRFKTMDEAMMAGINAALKHSKLSGLSENAQAVLQKNTFETIEKLQHAVSIVAAVDKLSTEVQKTDYEIKLETTIAQLMNLGDEIVKLGGSAEDVYKTIGKVLQEQFDAFRGIGQSEEDRIRQQAEALNRQLDHARNEMTKRMEAIQSSSVYQLEGTAEMMEKVMRLMSTDSQAAADQLKAFAGTLNLVNGGITEEAKKELLGLADAIAALPAAITETDIQEAIARETQTTTPSSGGGRRQRREDFRKRLDDLIAGGLDPLAQITRQYTIDVKELREEAHKLGITTEELTGAEQAMAEARDRSIRQLGESMLSSLSDVEALAFRMRDLGDEIAYLRDHAEEFGYTAERVDAAIQRFGQQQFMGIASELAGIIGDEELIAELRKAEQQARIAFLELQSQMLFDAGLMTEAQMRRIKDLAERARDALDDVEDTTGPGLTGKPNGRGRLGGIGGSKGDLNAANAERRDELLGRFNLPSRAIREIFQQMRKDIIELKQSADELGLSAQQVRSILRETGRQQFVEIGERLAGMIGDEEALQRFQDLRHKLELAQLKLQIELLKTLNLLTREESDMLDDLFQRAKDFEVATDTGGGSGAGTYTQVAGKVYNPVTGQYTSASGSADFVASLQAKIDAAYARLLDLESQAGNQSPLEAKIAAINKEFKDLISILGESERITSLWAKTLMDVVNEFKDQLDDFRDSLLLNDRTSPLKLATRRQMAMENLIAAASDPSKLNDLTSLAQTFIDLAGEWNPVGSAGYQSDLDLVLGILEQAGLTVEALAGQEISNVDNEVWTAALQKQNELQQKQLESSQRQEQRLQNIEEILSYQAANDSYYYQQQAAAGGMT